MPSKSSFCRLLRPENSLDALAGGISVISLIARHHGSNYGPLAAADVCSKLKDLLQHSEAGVRSRTCNLIGNLCRHLPTFYPALQKHRLLPILISNCEDKDVNTRKFACFAIGNAGGMTQLAPHLHSLNKTAAIYFPCKSICDCLGMQSNVDADVYAYEYCLQASRSIILACRTVT